MVETTSREGGVSRGVIAPWVATFFLAAATIKPCLASPTTR